MARNVIWDDEQGETSPRKVIWDDEPSSEGPAPLPPEDLSVFPASRQRERTGVGEAVGLGIAQGLSGRSVDEGLGLVNAASGQLGAVGRAITGGGPSDGYSSGES